MNYKIESSFLNDENLGVMIWAEKMLQKFVISKDLRLGLNNCSKEEREIIKAFCKSYFIRFCEVSDKYFLEKTEDSRAPFLCLRNYLTKKKINKHFKKQRHKFFDNADEFPRSYRFYKSEIRKESLFPFKKVTNKELLDLETSK